VSGFEGALNVCVRHCGPVFVVLWGSVYKSVPDNARVVLSNPYCGGVRLALLSELDEVGFCCVFHLGEGSCSVGADHYLGACVPFAFSC